MKLQSLIQVLEEFAPLSFQEEYDNSGLLIGDPQMEINGVLICLDLSLTVLSEAIERKCNLILSHHPVMFRGIRKIISGDRDSDIICEAIRKKIAIYTMHTNLDNSAEGLNRLLCNKLDLNQVELIQPRRNILLKLATFCPVANVDKVRDALFEAGAGHIGNYDCCSYNVNGKGTFRASDAANPFTGKKNILHVEEEIRIEVILPSHLEKKIVNALIKSHPYEEVAYDIYPLTNKYTKVGAGMSGLLSAEMNVPGFLENVRSILNLQVLRYNQFAGKFVKSVAICSGSGSFLINDVLRLKIDAYLTADLKYHDFTDVYGKLLLVDIGHYESECCMKELVADLLIKKFPTFAVLISVNEKNPVNYFKS